MTNTLLTGVIGVTTPLLTGTVVEWQLHCWQELWWSDKYPVDRSYSKVTNILLTETKVEWHLYCCQDYTGVKNTPLRSYSGVTNTMLIEAIIEWQIHCWLKLQRRDKYTVERSYSRMTNTLLARQGLYRQVWVKFKDYSRTSKSLSVFRDLKLMKDTDLVVKSQLQKC